MLNGSCRPEIVIVVIVITIAAEHLVFLFTVFNISGIKKKT